LLSFIDPQIIQGILTSGGAVMAAITVAAAGLFGYGRQKSADRRHELLQRRQREYERFLTAFGNAGRWKGIDAEKHATAEAEYHEAHSNILLIGSDDVMAATNAFHRYYVDAEWLDWRRAKRHYAEMVVAMRKDSFEESRFTVEEVAANIPWTIGDEPEELKKLRRQTQLERLPAERRQLVQPGDMSGGTSQPEVVERQLVAFRWEADSDMVKDFYEPGGTLFSLHDHEFIASFGPDWTAASHTFQVAPDGAIVLSVLFERHP
jgi:hypothetical protein